MNLFIERIKEADGFVSLTSATDEQIEAAEKRLCLHFSNDFREYLNAFGVAAFDGRELTGICSSDRLNVVAVTERAREYYKSFPEDAYVIEELHVDHEITIQRNDGTVWGLGFFGKEILLAKSLSDYLFPNG